jgi:hypothetical protein
MAVIHPDGSTSSLEVDFALALLSGIESAKKDPAQLRHIVYELARVSLEREVRKQGHDGSPSVNVCETPRLMLAFEAAIGHVERFSREQEKLPYPPADLRSLHGPGCPADAAVSELRQSPQAYQARKSNEAHAPYESRVATRCRTHTAVRLAPRQPLPRRWAVVSCRPINPLRRRA